jgi:hypothetical protein
MFEAGVKSLSPSREVKTRPSFTDATNTPQRACAESLSAMMRSMSFVRTKSAGEADALLGGMLAAASDFAVCGSFEALVASSKTPISAAVAVNPSRKRRGLIILKTMRKGCAFFNSRTTSPYGPPKIIRVWRRKLLQR